MIGETDTLVLPPGVTVSGGSLVDAMRGATWPLNASGAFVLARTGRPVGQVVRETADAFSLPVESARRDVLRFAWTLNALALLNVERGGSSARNLFSWIQLAVRLAPAGAIPGALARRREVDTGSVRRAVASVFTAILSRIVVVSAGSAAVATQLSATVGARGILASVALGVGTGAGMGLHEAAHAASLCGVPTALVMRGRRTYVLHPALGPLRRSLVAVAGPLAAVGTGLALVLGGVALTAPVLVLVGSPLVAHALALTVVGGDGRVACGL